MALSAINSVTAEVVSGATKYVRADGTKHVETTGAAYTVLPGEDVVVVKDSDPAVTITLPSLTAVPVGWRVTVKDGSDGATANSITVDGAGDETIDGAANTTIDTDYGSVVVEAGAAEWNIIGGRGVGAKVAVTGARDETEGAMVSLLAALVDQGLITNGTTAS